MVAVLQASAQSRKAIQAANICNVMEWSATTISACLAGAVAICGGFAPFISQGMIDVTGSKMAPTTYAMAATVVSFLTMIRLHEPAHEPLR
jgi:MHS family proline/betaine transporter-like MFS transporter